MRSTSNAGRSSVYAQRRQGSNAHIPINKQPDPVVETIRRIPPKYFNVWNEDTLLWTPVNKKVVEEGVGVMISNMTAKRNLTIYLYRITQVSSESDGLYLNNTMPWGEQGKYYLSRVPTEEFTLNPTFTGFYRAPTAWKAYAYLVDISPSAKKDYPNCIISAQEEDGEDILDGFAAFSVFIRTDGRVQLLLDEGQSLPGQITFSMDPEGRPLGTNQQVHIYLQEQGSQNAERRLILDNKFSQGGIYSRDSYLATVVAIDDLANEFETSQGVEVRQGEVALLFQTEVQDSPSNNWEWHVVPTTECTIIAPSQNNRKP